MNKLVTTLQFGSAGTIRFEDCEDIVRDVPDVFCGWQITRAADDHTGLSAIVTRQSGGWHWQSFENYRPRDWDSHPPKSAIRVITDVHEAVLHWYLAAHPDILGLHAGAAQLGNKLICFPAHGRAGKSTLIANLAFLGCKVFGDDVVGCRKTEGISLGLRPRLRLPLAASLTPKVRTFITKNAGPTGHGWHHLKTDETRMARLEETCPFGAIVLLQRASSGGPRLTQARTADVLACLVSENIMRIRPMIDIFDAMYGLANSLPRLWLHYSDPLRAAELLTREFAQ